MLSNIWQWFLTFSYFCVCAPSIWIMLFKLIKNPPSIGHWLLTQEAAGISLCSLPLAWRRKWQSTPVLLPGKSHGQRRLVGYSPWGRKWSDKTSLSLSLSLCLHEVRITWEALKTIPQPRSLGLWWGRGLEVLNLIRWFWYSLRLDSS